MSPCWASLTLFTYRVQTIPECLLGVERKALYPQLRQRCQCSVFQLLFTFRWLRRNSLSPGVTSEECPCVCISPSCLHAKGKSALWASPMLLEMGWCSCRWVPASLLWDDPNAESHMPRVHWGWAESRRCCRLGGPGRSLCMQTSAGPVKSHWMSGSTTGSRRMLPQPRRAKAVCCAVGWLCCRSGSCRAGGGCSACPSRGCRGDGLWYGAGPAARPSVIRAGGAEKALLALLWLTCGWSWGSPCDFWGVSQRHGVSPTTHTWKERSSIPIAGIWHHRHPHNALQPTQPHTVLGLCFPWAYTVSWHALPWCIQWRLNKEKWEAFNTFLHHL